MVDQERLERKLQSFPKEYMRDFDYFWTWKLQVETEAMHILDEAHRKIAYSKLVQVLARWQAYRRSRNPNPWLTLKHSLDRISEYYNHIRKYSLLEFHNIPDDALEFIWHELGRVKEYESERNSSGRYYVISVCKPLMLVWGQTPAFDSNVRAHIAYTHNCLSRNRWTFEEWKEMMSEMKEEISHDQEILGFMRRKSLEKYGNDVIVPYGRFLDIYYF